MYCTLRAAKLQKSAPGRFFPLTNSTGSNLDGVSRPQGERHGWSESTPSQRMARPVIDEVQYVEPGMA